MSTLTRSALPLSILFVACASTAPEPPDAEPSPSNVAESSQALKDPACAANPQPSLPPSVRADPTLVIRDAFVLKHFPLSRVMQQLVDISGTARSATDVYKQWWDTLSPAAGAMFPADPHPLEINGFAVEQNRPEVVLRTGVPDDLLPVALFNRFDLAPKDGAHCGEYRIVYTRGPGAPGFGRNFAIFEGILPNPTPGCGVEACRPVVALWRNLASADPATKTGQAQIIAAMEALYFDGLPGFEPVVHPAHYGASGGSGYGNSGGQIRVNMFMGAQWQLREYHLETECSGKLPAACHLQLQPVTVKSNPFPTLFDETDPEARGPAFRASFIDSVRSLASVDRNTIAMSIDDTFNAGESNAQAFDHKYEENIDTSPVFQGDIDAELAVLGITGLDAEDIAVRATTQSCAGCHQLSVGAPLGGGAGSWPNTLGFVHVAEDSTLSPALRCVFLPFRKQVLDGFAGSPKLTCAEVAAKPKDPLDAVTTMGGKSVGAAN
jgi:hypothetical protein